MALQPPGTCTLALFIYMTNQQNGTRMIIWHTSAVLLQNGTSVARFGAANKMVHLYEATMYSGTGYGLLIWRFNLLVHAYSHGLWLTYTYMALQPTSTCILA
jgi:hypothetical protein